MTEARHVHASRPEPAPGVRTSAATVLVLLLFTSGIFAVTQPGYGPAACRVLVHERQDCYHSLAREPHNRTVAASGESLDCTPLDRSSRPMIHRALRLIEGRPAPRAPGVDV